MGLAMPVVDLNADLGESFGNFEVGRDEELIPLVTSANVACGFHGGDPRVMDRTVQACRAAGVAVGAHPSFPDLVGFGRRAMDVTPAEAETDVVYQVAALAGFCRRNRVGLQHVKPHGAINNLAARDPALADAIAAGVASFDPGLILVCQSGTELARAAERAGLRARRHPGLAPPPGVGVRRPRARRPAGAAHGPGGHRGRRRRHRDRTPRRHPVRPRRQPGGGGLPAPPPAGAGGGRGGAATPGGGAGTVRLRPGDPAPDFRLPDQDGRPVDLRDLRGRRVVMYFYPRDGTPGCTVEACQFNDALAGFTALGVEVLGVSGDDAASHRSFREGHGLRFRLLTDADHRVATAYGAF